MTLTPRPISFMPDHYRLTATARRRRALLPSAGWAAFELGLVSGWRRRHLAPQRSQARPIVIHDESPSLHHTLTTENCRPLATLAGRTVYLALHDAEIPSAPRAGTDHARAPGPGSCAAPGVCRRLGPGGLVEHRVPRRRPAATPAVQASAALRVSLPGYRTRACSGPCPARAF
jgi:hypothetical protein